MFIYEILLMNNEESDGCYSDSDLFQGTLTAITAGRWEVTDILKVTRDAM